MLPAGAWSLAATALAGGCLLDAGPRRPELLAANVESVEPVALGFGHLHLDPSRAALLEDAPKEHERLDDAETLRDDFPVEVDRGPTVENMPRHHFD